ncbi:MAG: LVIVD repeat-containing protein [Gemmatimonadota bacterium]
MTPPRIATRVVLAAAIVASAACASSTPPATQPRPAADPRMDARVGLKAGLMDAGEAVSNMKIVSKAVSPEGFLGKTNSDLAFTGKYAIQGNYNGWQVWDISNPAKPTLVRGFVCPASQSDVSVYKNLLFVSGEGMEGRLDCGTQGVREAVSKDRLRGIRIFDITDIANPKNVANVQTCRGSHTHTVLEDPKDKENVYIYVSGSAPVRSADELPGCVRESPEKDPSSALFRIEVIKVPLARPQDAAIVSSPRIFENLTAPKGHGAAPEDKKAADEARAKGAFVAEVGGESFVLPPNFTRPMLDSIVKARGGSGAPTAADSTALRNAIPAMIARMMGEGDAAPGRPRPGPTQCHDITVYPAVGLAGGACEGYGLLLDIRDPVNPKRIAAAADSNFAYWHSATFNNDGTKILFSDEWGGGGAPKCRASDPKEWGADAIFTVNNGKLEFQSYYKLPAAQTSAENCVAHNGSLIPIPGRDVMVQAWYQGGISVFDWTDAKNPQEIAFFDRGPVDSTQMRMGGSWSVYWYNGAIVSSEIARGLDVMELTPSQYLTQNEIDAAKTVHWDYLNAQGQPKIVWPPSFALARAYLDQLERNKCLSASRIGAVRSALAGAEKATGAARQNTLTSLSSQLAGEASGSCDAGRVRKLSDAIKDLSVTS